MVRFVLGETTTVECRPRRGDPDAETVKSDLAS